MASPGLDNRFLDTTRGRIVRLLRRAPRTVDELAGELGLTDNAVRAHLAGLERDGLVRTEGVRRGGGAGKPATIYAVAPEAEPLFSRAYAPLLSALLGALGNRLPEAELRALMGDVGRRLAAAQPVPPSADFDGRVRAAAAILAELGAEATIAPGPDGGVTIQGCACPVSVAVATRAEACTALEALLADLTGGTVRERCERDGRPRCRFEIIPTGAARP